MKVRIVLYDDQCVLKLPGPLGVEPEIRLERNLQMHALRDIHKRAARPDCTVQGCKLMICRRNQLHEMIPDHVRIRAMQRAFDVRVDNAQLLGEVLNIVVNQLRVVLSANARKRLPFRLRNAKALEGILDLLRHAVPVVRHLCVRADIGRDVLHIQSFNGRTPVRHLGVIVDFQRLHAEIMHPLRVIFLFGYLLDNLRGQAFLDAVCVLLFIPEVIHAPVNVGNICFLCHLTFPQTAQIHAR